ncbi:MAG: hypothetical protein WCX80_04145 [Patescibacteria group bacterium]|jgi:hypothetical protein
MDISLQEKTQKALLTSLFQRIKGRLQFLGRKKSLLVDSLIKKSDADKLQKIREDIFKQ